jgi:hypothetical protein
MKEFHSALIVCAAAGALSASAAWAGPERVSYPAEYKEKLVQYTTRNREEKKQVVVCYANDSALEGAAEGGKLPNGSVLVMEVYKAKLDADGNPVSGEDGLFLPDDLAVIAVMEKQPGWGDAYPEDLRNGDWDYAFFTPEGTHKEGTDVNKCLECHKPMEVTDYVFTFGEVSQAAQ